MSTPRKVDIKPSLFKVCFIAVAALFLVVLITGCAQTPTASAQKNITSIDENPIRTAFNRTIENKTERFTEAEVVGNVSTGDRRAPYEIFVDANTSTRVDYLTVAAAWELEYERLNTSNRVNISTCSRKALLTSEDARSQYTHVFVWRCTDPVTGNSTELSFKKDLRAVDLEPVKELIRERTRPPLSTDVPVLGKDEEPETPVVRLR
jgi:hypothetical protein